VSIRFQASERVLVLQNILSSESPEASCEELCTLRIPSGVAAVISFARTDLLRRNLTHGGSDDCRVALHRPRRLGMTQLGVSLAVELR